VPQAGDPEAEKATSKVESVLIDKPHNNIPGSKTAQESDRVYAPPEARDAIVGALRKVD
jgi:hypothetical protein